MTTITDLELKLLELADEMGVRVEEDHGLLMPGDHGGWFPAERLIVVSPTLGPRNRVHTLGHELGHAHYGDPAGHHPRHEHRADVFAANLLIAPHDYAELEMMYDGQAGAIAAELGVTVSLLATWRADQEMRTA